MQAKVTGWTGLNGSPPLTRVDMFDLFLVKYVNFIEFFMSWTS